MHELIDLDDREQYGEHDEQNDPTHHQYHHRLDQRQEDYQAPLECLSLEVRGTRQHLLQFSAHFSARYQMYEQGENTCVAPSARARLAPSRTRSIVCSMAALITMLVTTRSPELSAARSGTPPRPGWRACRQNAKC